MLAGHAAVSTAHSSLPQAKEKRGMGSKRLLIHNGFVVSMDPDVGDIPNGDVLVEDGRIVEVGRGLTASEVEEIDATGMIVMPGFVDTHRHTWQTPVRGVLPSCTLDNYFAVMLGNVGGHYRPEDVHIANHAGALEALNGGVTTLLDWSHISNTPDHSDAAIQGLKDAGIRAIYAHGVPTGTGGNWWSLSDLNHPEDIRRIRETYFSSDDGLLTLALAARAPGNTSFDVAKHDWELARDLDIRISVHVGMRLTSVHVHHVENIHDLGLLGPDTTYIHCTDSTDEELDLIAETGGTASVAPYVEMLMGHGPPPTGRLVERGVRPSLSVDVVSSVPGEMFTQMRTALVHNRIGAFTDTPDEAFAPTLTHRDVLEFATIAGARACALEDKVGSLTPGKQADLVLLKVNAINTAPMVDPVATIVVFSDTSNVDSVFVAGRAVKRNGKLVDVDLDRIFGKLDESRNHILSRGDLLPDWAAEPVGAV
jgi:5-methylthioadenosine/S-adenosylhomocysteine deaminase